MQPSSIDRIETILLPLDGSSFSLHAVPAARHFARELDAGVMLMSVVPDEDAVPPRAAELAQVEIPGVSVQRTVVVDDDPADAIHGELRRLGRAVACLATHGRGRTAGLIGSVATAAVSRGHDPLILVGRNYDSNARGRGVVGWVDDHPNSAAAVLPAAVAWGARLSQPLAVGTVAEPVPEPVGRGPARRLFGPDGDVAAFLEELVKPLQANGVQVETLAVFDPIRPADGIRSHLAQYPADLSIVASRSRSGLARAVFGSEAAHIVHNSPGPVLVVPKAALSD